MPRNKYSDNDKALSLTALDANAGNVLKTAKQMNIPRVTLLDWSKGRKINAEVSELRHIKKGELSDRLEELAQLLLDGIPAKVGTANLQQMTTSLAIAIDKMLLLKGKPTSIPQYPELSDEERARRINELLERGRSRIKLVK